MKSESDKLKTPLTCVFAGRAGVNWRTLRAALARGVAVGIWNPMTKKVPEKLLEKYPKEVKEGSKMDYADDALAFPKSKKKRKKGWAKKT